MTERLKKKIKILIVFEIIALIFMGVFLYVVQGDVSLDNYKADMKKEISQAKQLIEESDEETADTTSTYDEIYKAKAASVAFMAKNNVGFEATDDKLKELKELLDVDNLLIIDSEGKTVAEAEKSPANFTFARFNQLKNGFTTGKVTEPFEVELKDSWYRYYGMKLDDDKMIVLEQNPEEMYNMIDETTSIESVLKNLSIGGEGYMFSVSGKNYVIDYHPDEDLVGADALTSGITVEDLEDGNYTWLKIDGKEYYCGISEIDGDYYIGAIPKSEIEASRNITVGVILFIFFVVTSIAIVYGVLIIVEDNKKRRAEGTIEENYSKIGGRYYNKAVGGKIRIISVVGLVLVLVISFYMQSLFGLSGQSMTNEMRVKEVEDTIADYEKQIDEQTELYNERYLNKAEIAAYIINRNSELADRDKLRELASVLQIQDINVFDAQGVMTKTSSPYSNFSVSQDPEDQSYDFNKLLQGVEYYIQEAQKDDIADEFHQYIGVTLRTPEGDPDGFVQIAIRPHRLENLIENMQIDKILDGVKVGADGYAFAVDKKDKTFAYFPNEKAIGKKVSDYGITKEVLKDGYSDYMEIKGERVYASSVETGDYYVYVAVPGDEIMSERIPMTVTAGIICLICMIFIFLVLSFGRKGEGPLDYAQEHEDERNIEVTMPDGRKKKTQSAESRWSSLILSWDDKTAGQQVATLVKYAVYILAFAVCIAVIFKDSFFGKTSVFNYILGGGWSPGINIFAITSNIIIICITMTVVTLVRNLLKILATTLGARGETVCRLISSFLKYIAIIAMLYMCFAKFGVDTGTLLASAGILSIAISFGAKELVADILSGLFIIFEGEFRVGDIIMIGDWRGTVVEIGVRTTKIEDGDQNIKVVRNSEVSNIVNMTKQYSYAACDVGIEYGESLERIENILEKEMPKIKRNVSSIVEGPFYKGVVALADNSVNIRIVAQCHESDRIQTERDLNREMKLIFDKYNINIPFPQVVVNEPIEFEKATWQEKQAAKKFVEEQKLASKNLGNEDDDDGR